MESDNGPLRQSYQEPPQIPPFDFAQDRRVTDMPVTALSCRPPLGLAKSGLRLSRFDRTACSIAGGIGLGVELPAIAKIVEMEVLKIGL
jgi:hypothetical protein